MRWLLQTTATPSGTVDFETAKFTQSLALNGTEDDAEGMEVHTAPIPTSAKMAIEPTLGTVNAPKIKVPSDGTKKNGNPLASLQFIFPTSSASAMRRSGAGNCGGSQAAGAFRRLKNPCGFPSKTGADVVHRVSGGYPPKSSRVEISRRFWSR